MGQLIENQINKNNESTAAVVMPMKFDDGIEKFTLFLTPADFNRAQAGKNVYNFKYHIYLKV